jgi:hypothetical protein
MHAIRALHGGEVQRLWAKRIRRTHGVICTKKNYQTICTPYTPFAESEKLSSASSKMAFPEPETALASTIYLAAEGSIQSNPE